MDKSTSIQNIAKALLTFQVKVDKIKKDSENPFFKSSYASLPHIQTSIHDALVECNLVYSQMPDGVNGLTTLIMHTESGEFLQSTYTMTPAKQDPQGVGSCITYQKRYALVAALGLTIDEDDDGNTATHGSKAPQATSYNHRNIGTQEKPLIGNEAFKKACERLKAGEVEVYDKVLATYSLEATQKSLFDTLHKKAKKDQLQPTN